MKLFPAQTVLSIFVLFAFAKNSIAQFSIDITKTPTDLVRELVGDSIEFSNVVFNGVVDSGVVQWGTGTFLEPEGRLDGIEKGIVLSTIKLDLLENPPSESQKIRNDENGVDKNHKYFDDDLAILAPGNDHMYEGAVLEFDFVPKGDFMGFNYVFASDEYHYFVCSKFNDVFGFFLSGPGINGPFSNNAVNLALIPGTETPVAINTVNRGIVG